MINIKRIITAGMIAAAFMPVCVKAQTYIQLADSADNCIKAGKWAEAEQAIYKALRLEPGNFNNALLLSNLGYLQSRRGDYKEAIENYSLGLAISPRSTVLLTNRAKTYLLTGEEKKAAEDLDRAIAIDSTLTDARKTRGFLLLKNSRYGEAEKDFRFLLSRHASEAEAYAGLAGCQSGRLELKEAIGNYSKSLEISKDENNYFRKIYLLAETGELPEAMKCASEALREFPDNGNLYLIRAYISKLNYRLADAERDKKQALDHNADPEFVQIFFGEKRK